MKERNFKTADLISILLLFVQVVDSFKIIVTRDTLLERGNNKGRRQQLEENETAIERLRKDSKPFNCTEHGVNNTALLAIDSGLQANTKTLDRLKQVEETLKKVLRSVDDEEHEDRQIRDIESALRSIERETAYHESRKRTRIEKVLASVDEHTNLALAKNNSSSKDTKQQNADSVVVSIPFNDTRSHEGRTINLKANGENKRVFIPKGWMFCTIAPPKCYSTNKKKRHIKKRHVPLELRAKHYKVRPHLKS